MEETLLRDHNEFFAYKDFFELLEKYKQRSVAWRAHFEPRDLVQDDYAPTYTYEQLVPLTRDCQEDELVRKQLLDVLQNRRSDTFGEGRSKWKLSDLSKLLAFAAGTRPTDVFVPEASDPIHFRTYPSGGAMYSVLLFLITKGIEGLPDGLYRYGAEANALYRFGDPVSQVEIEQLFPVTQFRLSAQADSLTESPVFIFFVSNYRYLFQKYGFASYPLSLLEAGHICQNIQLMSTALGKSSRPVAGLFADRIEKLLGIRNRKYLHCVYSVILW
ncbi:SagB family peptide dehydrogenase [Paenibacillus azoreducens]|uniref:Nitroreductase domain-containing protein n=1 Tax=Paenibacillus azoreducens TaxID=116718 RepID=A0A919Y8R6_9BACL|nr:SagB family peptide dehydrogenase [Paenibacillus azoreducens]GIO46294.1 hypothetical protein J34TS1_10590 [Paenibacillus azoreducens]